MENTSEWFGIRAFGIGGSALGPEAVAEALGSPTYSTRQFFFDDTRRNGMGRRLGTIGVKGVE